MIVQVTLISGKFPKERIALISFCEFPEEIWNMQSKTILSTIYLWVYISYTYFVGSLINIYLSKGRENDINLSHSLIYRENIVF